MDFKTRTELGLIGVKSAPKKREPKVYHEASEQSTIGGYMKKHHPDIPFETVKHEGKKEMWERNQHQKQNSYDSFPDTRIYLPAITLMIENKRLGTKLTLLDGRIASDHLQNQYNTHKRLFNDHTKVYFCVGVYEAIELIEQAIRGCYPPMQIFLDR